jgi:hypothetical protein
MFDKLSMGILRSGWLSVMQRITGTIKGFPSTWEEKDGNLISDGHLREVVSPRETIVRDRGV